MMASDGERAFETRLKQLAPDLATEAQREYRFQPPRRWRFDFAWPSHNVAVEIDGGRWQSGGGKHSTAADYEKLNNAAAAGWLVLRFLPVMIDHDPQQCVALLRAAISTKS